MSLNKRRATPSSAFLGPTRRAMAIFHLAVLKLVCVGPLHGSRFALPAEKIADGRNDNEASTDPSVMSAKIFRFFFIHLA